MADPATEKKELEWNFGEILPDNARTDEIMKQRAEKAELERQKADEMRQLKEKEAKA